MTQKSDRFVSVVKESRVLSVEQKALLLGGPKLPEEYQKNIITFLQKFDKNSKARELFLRDKMEVLYTEFIAQLDAEGIGEETKKGLMEKAKNQIANFFPKNSPTE